MGSKKKSPHTNQAQPYVSVVIPVYNDKERLRKCLKQVVVQDYPQEAFEIIVVDNGSDDGVEAVTRAFPKVKKLREPRQGSYAARNKGIKHAKGEVIAFTDADCQPERNWLREGVAALKTKPKTGLVGGGINFVFENPDHPTLVELYDSVKYLNQEKYIEQDKFGATANVFTFRHVIDKVGAFNARLASGGDYEWGRRVYEAGFGVVYAPQASVDHPARATSKSLISKTRRVTAARCELGYHHYSINTLLFDVVKGVLPPRPSAQRELLQRFESDLSVVDQAQLYMLVWGMQATKWLEVLYQRFRRIGFHD